MIVEIETKLPKRNTEELLRAAEFFAAHLMAPDELRDLDVEIVVDKNLKCSGFISVLDDDARPRSFLVELQAGPCDEVISTLAHEFVHIKQYVRGELKSYAKKHKFKGKTYLVEDIDYFDRPWEIEAYGREVGLKHRYSEQFERICKKRI